MPRKKPIRTLAQMNSANAKKNLKGAKTLARVTKSSFVAAVSARYIRRYMQRMRTSSAKEQRALFKSMPTYETVVACADKKTNPLRRKWEQRERAKKPRKYKAYAIGAESGPGESKLPLTLSAFIGDLARGARGTARQIWDGLETPLKSVAADVTLSKDPTNPRADIYTFVMGGDLIVLKYGQFEKIFTASRKPRKVEI
jgi:hypothetical protein